jgi:AGCS family alanine or glycine:cation symporter
MQTFINAVNSIVWSPALIYLSLGAGLFFSFKTRFVQVRLFREMIRLVFSGRVSELGVSSFQALSLSLSGRVGVGNIAGVAAAIGFGGPGAVFWMWVVAFLGASTAFVESTLGQIYKEVVDGEYRGGPAYYLEKVTGSKSLGILFAIITITAIGILLPGVQANAISSAAVLAFGSGTIIPMWFGDINPTKGIAAIAVVVLLGVVIFGGLKRIASVTQVAVPFMALAYIFTASAIIIVNIGELPHIISMIFSDAFTPMAGFGAAIGWGIKRGVFSSEAGLGSACHASSAAEVEHPAQQGLVQALSIYIDTLVVCSATAFMILITGAYNVQDGHGGFAIHNVGINIDPNGPAFTQLAVESALPGFGQMFVALALFFFAFTTILAYYYIAETNIVYIRKYFKIRGAESVLKIVLLSSAFYGSIKTASLAWGLGDIGIALMAWFNMVGMLLIYFIANPALKALSDYEDQRQRKLTKYSFDPAHLGITNAEFWQNRLNEERKRDRTD